MPRTRNGVARGSWCLTCQPTVELLLNALRRYKNCGRDRPALDANWGAVARCQPRRPADVDAKNRPAGRRRPDAARGDAPCEGLRKDDLLKVKTHKEAEAHVLAHIAGKGKNACQLDTLIIKLPAAGECLPRRFRLEVGFSEVQWQDPPAVGAQVTYRFRGLNNSGTPRFASFARVRNNGPT